MALMMAAAGYAVVLESFGKGEAPGSASMPACIVLERWDYSLSDWNNKLQRQPDDVELKSALYMVKIPPPLSLCRPLPVAMLHAAVKPGRVCSNPTS